MKAHALESIRADDIRKRPIWAIKNGIRLMVPNDEEPSHEKLFEGGRVGTLIQMVNDIGGMTVIPQMHIGLILYSWQSNIRPIVNPELKRTISIIIRRDYIHEAKLNAVIRAIKGVIPSELLESTVRGNYIKL